MVDLIPDTPLATRLPVTIGATVLAVEQPAAITALAPVPGREKALSAALKQAHGMALPGPGRTTGRKALKAVWAGFGRVLLVGDAPADPGLAAHALLADQSAAWLGLAVKGTDARAVMARLCPVDIDPRHLPPGRVALTEVGQIACIVMPERSRFRLLAPRSLAGSLTDRIIGAMRRVAAQSAVADRA